MFFMCDKLGRAAKKATTYTRSSRAGNRMVNFLTVGELVARFFLGGTLVAIFAVIGDLFTPKSFAGLFAAAPSVALATMLLTLHKEGASFVAVEARSMIVGALAFTAYASVVAWVLHRRRARPTPIAVAALAVWGVVAAAGWALFVRPL